MTDEEVIRVMQPLTAAFAFASNEDTITLWVDELSRLPDFHAAMKTAAALVKNATDRYVPAIGSFLADYRRWAERHQQEQGTEANMDRLAIDRSSRDRNRIPTWEEGVAIAAVDYADECARQGREPTPGMVESWLGAGREDRKSDPRNNRGYNPRKPFS